MVEKLFSRREVIEGGSLLGIIALGLLGIREGVRAVINSEHFNQPNILDQKINHHSYRFVFWRHGNEGVKSGNLEPGFFPHDLVFFEGGETDYLEIGEGLKVIETLPSEESLEWNDLISSTLANGKQLIISDLPFNSLFIPQILPGLELGVSIGSWKVASKTIRRRSILRLISFLSLGGITHSLAGCLSRIFPVAERFVPLGLEGPGIQKSLEDIQPYDLFIRIRNLVAALKILDLNQDQNVLFGMGHVAIPAYMATPEAQLFVDLRNIAPLLKIISRGLPTPEYFYTSLLFKPISVEFSKVNVEAKKIVHQKLKEFFEQEVRI